MTYVMEGTAPFLFIVSSAIPKDAKPVCCG